MTDTEKAKLDFMYKSIDDAVSNIRAMDIKSNVLIAFIGVMVFAVIKINNDNISIIMALSILCGLGTAIVFVYGVVLPRVDPDIELYNVNEIINNDLDKKLFFPRKCKNLKLYYNNINNLGYNDFLKLLSYERLKLQIIFDKKTSYFKIGLTCLVIFFLLILINLAAGI
ncbi:hypothetical protein [Nitratifractor salsuginis]|uniref:Pycsar effector protein domain-containing protein n=1 Tax=Nitratifractor salsuginis (strain DSM 16511 / JCM 12458 / E9I37-1) TaxID=749222 RepID=E6X1E2_NITSE|nr:hypothetical protein [Nitratifractor salsuginis]ADV45875.1 hypothetical protein Nitsa_0607 [Nitratifractor salsuginis DSM 16511]